MPLNLNVFSVWSELLMTGSPFESSTPLPFKILLKPLLKIKTNQGN